MAAQELIIEAGQTEKQYWRDLWGYRELFFFLTWRDILVRYKQTAIGIAWAVVRPLTTMVVFTLVFDKLMKLPSGQAHIPYPILTFTALLPWQFFSGALIESGNSLVSNANLISKIYFPRLLVPASAIVTTLIDFLLAGLFLGLLLAWYQFMPSWRIWFLPIFMLLACATALGPGLWLAALNVKFRDVRFIIPFVVQTGLFISPVIFSSTRIPQPWRLLYSANPMVGVIDGFRWAILGAENELYLPGLAVSLTVSSLLLWGGIRYFRQTERSFADVI